MMANKAGFILQLVIWLNVHQVLSQCTTIDFCSLRSTRGISAHNSSMAKRSMSMTCQRACSLHPGCIATTYDSTRENCELHEAGVDGIPCMTLDTEEGSTFWMTKPSDRSCPKSQGFDNDFTCDATILGARRIDGTDWSDEMCALIHGPVTGVRIWTSTYINLFQVRYGQHWAPIHPDLPVSGSLTEILLASDEVFIQINARSSAVIDVIQFISNLKSYTLLGRDSNYDKTVPLGGLLYFSGAAGNWAGVKVTRLIPHREKC